MHILIIPSEQFLPPLSPLSGIFQFHLAELLLDSGFQVGVISSGLVPFKRIFSNYPYKKQESIQGIRVLRSFKRSILPGRLYLKYQFRCLINDYIRLYEKYVRLYGQPDLIHAHNSLFAGAAANEIWEKYKIPYVLTEHSSLFERGLVPTNHYLIAKKAFQDAAVLTTVSSKQGKVLRGIFGDSVKDSIPIFNVIEKHFIDRPKLKKETSDNHFEFLSIGSLDSNKNHELLISAFHEAFREDDSVFLTIGGEGKLKEHLKKLIVKLGIEKNVQLCGRLDREEVRKRMQNCDVFVLPSNVETFGVVLIEAAVLGTPLISTYCGGPEDIVDEENGLLVPVKDVESLKGALLKMKSEYLKYDPKKIRENCLNKFGREEFFNNIKRIYLNVNKARK